MSAGEEADFLANYGHSLTVAARDTYEFQAEGVRDAIALRAFNEIHHRIYRQIQRLVGHGERNTDSDLLASWLIGKDRSPEVQAACLWALQQALLHARKDA
jgi:hypothetical protein